MPDNNNLLHQIGSVALSYSGDAAVIQYLAGREERVSFEQLWHLASGWRPTLDNTCEDDQFVLIFAKRSIHSLALMLACVMSGKTFAVLNNKLQIPQVENAINQCRAGSLWADDTTIALLKKHSPTNETIQRTQILAMQDAHWGRFQDKQFSLLQQHTNAILVSPQESRDFADYPGYETLADAPAACLFTSGSTGEPKGVLVSASDLSRRASSELAYFGLKPGERILNVLPWSFDVGLSQVLCTLLGGCSLVVIDSWLPADIVSASHDFEVDGISSVPSMWLDLLASGLSFETPAPRYVTVSGGSLPLTALAGLTALLPDSEIIRTYGQTETCRSAIGFKADFVAQPSSIGKAYVGTRVYVVNKALEQLPSGQEGELLHSGDGTMLSYLDGNDSSKRVRNPFFGVDGDESEFAILTGDRASQDSDGRIYLHGREDDLVKIKGNRVFLGEILNAVLSLQDIADAQVISYENENTVEIALFVVYAPGGSMKEGTAVLKLLSAMLPHYMLPSQILTLQQLPRMGNGKADRLKLLSFLENPT